MDSNRRIDLDDQHGRLCRLRQQPDVVRQSAKPAKFAASWSARKQCEITGVFVTPDERAMFVGIQHPGETADESPNDPANPKQFSSWPDGDAGGRPRSACIVITKDDGGQIGS